MIKETVVPVIQDSRTPYILEMGLFVVECLRRRQDKSRRWIFEGAFRLKSDANNFSRDCEKEGEVRVFSPDEWNDEGES